MDFKVFKDTVENDGEIKAIVAKGAAEQYTRKDMDALTEFVNIYGAKGLAWVKVVEDGLTGPIGRFFETENVETLLTLTGAEAGDFSNVCCRQTKCRCTKFRCITCQIS